MNYVSFKTYLLSLKESFKTILNTWGLNEDTLLVIFDVSLLLKS